MLELKKGFRMDLQLFADDADETDEGVVDPQLEDQDEFENLDDEILEDEDAEIDSDVNEDSEVVEPKQKQSKEENAAFRKLRLKAEEEANRKFEAQRKEVEAEKEYIRQQKELLQSQKIENESYNKFLTPQKIYDYAYQYGISEEQAQAELSQLRDQDVENQKKEIVFQQREEKLREYENRLKKEELKNEPFFNELEKDLDVLLLQQPNVDIHTAYEYLIGKNYKTLIANEKSNVEKRTIANMQDRAKRKTFSADGGSSEASVSSVLSPDGIEMANAFGVDPRKVAKRVQEQNKNKRR